MNCDARSKENQVNIYILVDSFLSEMDVGSKKMDNVRSKKNDKFLDSFLSRADKIHKLTSSQRGWLHSSVGRASHR